MQSRSGVISVIAGLALGLALGWAVHSSASSIANAQSGKTDSVSKPQKIVVHLSKAEGDNAIHSALMAFGLAAAMQKQGAYVTVMLDSEAPRLSQQSWANKTLPASAAMAKKMGTKPMTLGSAIASFTKGGGRIVMCPHCTAACGVKADGRLLGAQLGAEGELARLVLAADKVLDY